MRLLDVASEKRHPAFPDVHTFKELGFNWIDGAFRGIAVPKATPMEVQKDVSQLMGELNKDPETRKRLADGGYDLVDIGIDQIPDFLAKRSKHYLDDARNAGLIK